MQYTAAEQKSNDKKRNFINKFETKLTYQTNATQVSGMIIYILYHFFLEIPKSKKPVHQLTVNQACVSDTLPF